MADPEEKPNPFLTYAKSLPTRLIKTPINALKLPMNLISEVAGNGDKVVQAEQTQRDLIGKVTGETPNYSEGRRLASMFSLGLVPNNQRAAIDPSALPPDQQQNFGKLTKLQQALVQAKRPADFAKLIADGSLFEEDPPPKLTAVASNERLADPSGKVVLPAEQKDQIVPPGNMVVRDGEEVLTNDYEPPSLVESRGAAARASDAAANLSKQKIEESQANIGKIDAQADEARAGAAAKRAKANGQPATTQPIKDRSAIQAMEARVNTKVDKRVNDLDRGITAGRNFFQLYEMRGSGQTPAAYVADLKSMGFEDVENSDPRAVQDLMLMTLGVRISDPPGRITDKDVDMFSRARAYYDPGIVEAVAKRQVLTNAQRNELAVATKRLSEGILQANDMAVADGRKEALRDRIAGGGVGMNPMNIPDRAADIRMMLHGEEWGEQAAYPVADKEAEELLWSLWQTQNPGRQPSGQELIQFANDHGFRIDEFGDDQPVE